MRNSFAPDSKSLIHALSARLIHELAVGKQVLWLVPGGSNIAAAVAVMKLIPADLTPRLALTLTDERFGKPGHADSNFLQLEKAGFKPKRATMIPVLMGLNLEETRQRYEQIIQLTFEKADAVVAQFGIGSDGHIAGILPQSSAAQADTLVAAYEAPNYTRLTLTFPALSRIDFAYAGAFGTEKLPALTRLITEDVALAEQPSQILKQIGESFLFSDQIGDEA